MTLRFEYEHDTLETLSIELPLWLTRRPSAKVKEQFNAEQKAFWERVSAEAAIGSPLLNKLNERRVTYVTAYIVERELREAQREERDKARKNQDKAALSTVASANRTARLKTAQEAIVKAYDSYKAYQTSQDGLNAHDSESRLAKLWQPYMEKYNKALFAPPPVAPKK